MNLLNNQEELMLIKMEIDSIINLLILIQDSYLIDDRIDIDSLLLIPIESLIEINKTINEIQKYKS